MGIVHIKSIVVVIVVYSVVVKEQIVGLRALMILGEFKRRHRYMSAGSLSDQACQEDVVRAVV